MVWIKDRSTVINVKVFSHRSDIYKCACVVLWCCILFPLDIYLFYVYKLNLFIINSYEMFPVFFSLQQLKLIHAK